MTVPGSTERCWSDLEAGAKRDRLLAAAGEVFARDGIDAPMPAIAAAAGAGVGSVYRQFPSKQDLLAALMVERLRQVEEEADAALADPRGPWTALTELLATLAERQTSDDLHAQSMARLGDHPDVTRGMAATMASLEHLVDAAIAAGDMRADATGLDLRLLLNGTRAARDLGPDAWKRMLELGIDSLRARP